YYFYPHLDVGGLLVVDDIHIPTIFRLFSFLRDEEMFDFLGVSHTTAFFRRNAMPLFDPFGDGWWLQRYNMKRFLGRDFGEDFLPSDIQSSEDFERLLRERTASSTSARV